MNVKKPVAKRAETGPPDEYIGPSTAGRILGKSADMVRIYAAQGRLPFITAEGRRIFKRADVVRLAEELAAAPPSRVRAAG